MAEFFQRYGNTDASFTLASLATLSSSLVIRAPRSENVTMYLEYVAVGSCVSTLMLSRLRVFSGVTHDSNFNMNRN